MPNKNKLRKNMTSKILLQKLLNNNQEIQKFGKNQKYKKLRKQKHLLKKIGKYNYIQESYQ